MDEESNSNQELIDDRFKIVKEIGSGGMGSVFECIDINLQKTVAVKILKSFTENHLVRLQNEATVTGAIHHKNIVEVYDFKLTEQSQPYMVMEYIDGISLSEKIESGLDYSSMELLEIIIQICDGLFYAHSKGVLHRDIKPSNVMLIDGGNGNITVKLVDFGIAKFIDSNQTLTKTGAPLGSPLYMSPEQSRGVKLDNKSDIYSLGCLIYELFAGQPPFTDESLLELVNKHQNETPPPLFHEPVSDFQESLNAITDKCLQKNSTNRYVSVDKLRDDLTRLATSEENSDKDSESSRNSRSDNEKSKASYPKLALFVSILFVVILILVIALNVVPKKSPETNKSLKSIDNEKTTLTLKPGSPGEEFSPYENDLMPKSYTPAFKANTNVSDSDLELFATNHPNARGLVLKNSRVQGHGLKYLSNVPLKFLDISDVSIDSSDLTSIGKITTLEKLIMPGNLYTKKLDGDAYKSLVNLTNLKRLDLSRRYVSEKALKWISSISSLERINLREAEDLNKEGFKQLSKLKNLIVLRIDRAHVNDSMILSLGTMPLQAIHLDSNLAITSKSIVIFSSYPNLSYLSLSYPQKQNETSKSYFSAIAKIKSLDHLTLRNADLKDIRQIAKMPNLKTIIFQKQKITYKNLKQFESFLHLNHLELINDCQIKKGALKAIAQTPIETLIVGDSQISVAELKNLSSARNLKLLNLYNTSVSYNQFRQVKNSIPKDCLLKLK